MFVSDIANRSVRGVRISAQCTSSSETRHRPSDTRWWWVGRSQLDMQGLLRSSLTLVHRRVENLHLVPLDDVTVLLNHCWSFKSAQAALCSFFFMFALSPTQPFFFSSGAMGSFTFVSPMRGQLLWSRIIPANFFTQVRDYGRLLLHVFSFSSWVVPSWMDSHSLWELSLDVFFPSSMCPLFSPGPLLSSVRVCALVINAHFQGPILSDGEASLPSR